MEHSAIAPGGEKRDPIQEVAASIQARIDSIAETMVHRYRERIDTYADAPPDVIADAREWAHLSIEVTIGIVTGQLSAEDFIQPLTDVGRRRARQGFPLRDVLQANLIGAEVLWETMWAVAPENAELSLQIAKVATSSTMDLLQQAVTALSNGYLEVESARVADEEYDMQALVETLAGIRQPDRRHEERAELRGVDLSALRWCIVAQIDSDEIGELVRSIRIDNPDAAVGRIGHTIIGFFPGESAPKPMVSPAGIALAHDSVRGYKRARATLEAAIHLGQDFVFYDDVVPLAMILGGPEEERSAFVRAQLGALLDDQMGEELVKSLAAYYEAGQSIAAAARNLFVHRHTLEYRLSRIETLLARDIRAPKDRLLLELALAIRERTSS